MLCRMLKPSWYGLNVRDDYMQGARAQLTVQEAAAVVGGDLQEEGVLGVACAAGVAPHGVVAVRGGADGLQAPPQQRPVRAHRLPQRHLEDHEAPAPVRRHVPCAHPPHATHAM